MCIQLASIPSLPTNEPLSKLGLCHVVPYPTHISGVYIYKYPTACLGRSSTGQLPCLGTSAGPAPMAPRKLAGGYASGAVDLAAQLSNQMASIPKKQKSICRRTFDESASITKKKKGKSCTMPDLTGGERVDQSIIEGNLHNKLYLTCPRCLYRSMRCTVQDVRLRN